MNFTQTSSKRLQTVKNIAANSGWILFDKFVRIALGLFITGWMSRQLGPEGFGTLNYVFAVIGILAVGVNLGLDSVLVRDLSRKTYPADQLLWTAIGLRIIGAALAFLAGGAYVLYASPTALWTYLLCALTFFPQVFDVFELVYHSRLQSSRVVTFRGIAFALGTTLRILLLLQGASVEAFAGVVAIEAILGSSLIVLSFRKEGLGWESFRVSREIRVHLLKQSLPLIVSSFCGLVALRADLIVLESFSNLQTVGVFSVSPRVVDLLSVFVVAVVGSSMPVISKGRVGEPTEETSLLWRVLAGFGWLTAIGATFTAGWVLPLIFGPAFASSVASFQVYVWAFLFISSNAARSAVLVASGALWTQAAISGVTGALALAIYPWAAAQGDLTVLAMSVVLVHAFSCLALPVLFAESRKFWRQQVGSLLMIRL